jgi:hypothetical protein
MACCADSGGCAMHKANSHESGARRALTQAQADSCCASSQSDKSSQSIPTPAVSISPALLGATITFPPSVPTLVPSGAWRIVAPLPTTPTPRHVLLSVFLV